MALPLSAGEATRPEPGPAPAPAAPRMTPQELDEFATYYYRQPRPELIPAAIEALGSSGFLDPATRDLGSPRPNGRFWVFVGFFAEVFAANPDRVEEWRRVGAKDWATRDCLQAAAKFRPGNEAANRGRPAGMKLLEQVSLSGDER